MSSDLQQHIETVRRKAGLLTERIHILESASAADRRHIAELEERVADLERKLQEANLKLEYTAIVSSLAPTADDVDGTRDLLVRLVHEIDRCITDLND